MAHTIIKDLDKRLTELRKSRHLTQVQVGKAVNVSSSLVSAYELASRVPPLETIVKYAAFFKVSTDFILGCESKTPLNLDGLTPKDQDAILTLIESLKNRGHH